jgi:SAM-dependent methyltransferase
MNRISVPGEAIPYIRLHRTNLEGNIAARYAEAVAEDFKGMTPYLPPAIDALLDIGCGMAGIDVLFWREYCPRLFLLDGNGMTEVRTGFHERMGYYNSLPIARRLLEMNGVPPEHISTALPERCDLVISLFSWGFHYPVSTYLPLVRRVLRPGGRLILDICKRHDGRAELAEDFEPVGVLDSVGTAERVCFERRSDDAD